jgi:hypothetical protein
MIKVARRLASLHTSLTGSGFNSWHRLSQPSCPSLRGRLIGQQSVLGGRPLWETADVNACGRKIAGVSAYAAVGANYCHWLPAVSMSSARRGRMMRTLNCITFTFALLSITC